MNILLDQIYRSVKQHGFKAEISHRDNYVAISIPVACDGEHLRDDVIKVSTVEQARVALGY